MAADLPVLLSGKPGIGETAALTQLAAALDLPLTTVIASVHEPSDFSGLPIVGDDPAQQGVRWPRRTGPCDSYGPDGGCCSWTSCPPRRRPCRPLCSGSSWNGGSAPCNCRPGVRIWPPPMSRSSAADGWELSPPLANRFVHLQWTHGPRVVVRRPRGNLHRATLPRLDPEKLAEAVDFARRAVCGLLAARPGLVHRLPTARTAGAGPGRRREAGR
ncbi:AAA+ ATPase domain-containing protein OS=Streptomyces glaucescens OX=1907 GN=SGLAU_27055 PE=4 SV=1 [Streptomyces glaucescens]